MMKSNKKSVCTFFVIFFLSYFSKAQYSVVPTGTIFDLDEVEKFGENVVIMGNTDFLVKCNGDCNTLQDILPSNMDVSYSNGSLHLLDTANLYFVSFDNLFPTIESKMFRSIDGGQNWNNYVLPNNVCATELIIFDTNNICAFDGAQSYFTYNNGLSWTIGNSTTISTPSAAFLVNGLTAYIAGYQKIALTLDGGLNWVEESLGPIQPSCFAKTNNDSILFISNGGVNGKFSILTNNNLSSRIDREIPNTLPLGLYIMAVNEIYVTGKDNVTNKGRILKTTDLGQSWTYFDIAESKYLADLVPLNDSTFLIGGQSGLLIKWNKYSPMQSLSLNVQETSQISEINIFPNPVETFQQIHFKNVLHEEIDLWILDMQGRELINNYVIINQTNDQITCDFSKLPNGVYSLYIKIGDKTVHQNVIKI